MSLNGRILKASPNSAPTCPGEGHLPSSAKPPPSSVATFDRIAELPLEVEECEFEGLAFTLGDSNG